MGQQTPTPSSAPVPCASSPSSPPASWQPPPRPSSPPRSAGRHAAGANNRPLRRTRTAAPLPRQARQQGSAARCRCVLQVLQPGTTAGTAGPRTPAPNSPPNRHPHAGPRPPHHHHHHPTSHTQTQPTPTPPRRTLRSFSSGATQMLEKKTSFFSSLEASSRLRVLRDCVMYWRKYLRPGGGQGPGAKGCVRVCARAACQGAPYRWAGAGERRHSNGAVAVVRLLIKFQSQNPIRAVPAAAVARSLARHVVQHSARSGTVHAQVLERLLHRPPVLEAKAVDACRHDSKSGGNAEPTFAPPPLARSTPGQAAFYSSLPPACSARAAGSAPAASAWLTASLKMPPVMSACILSRSSFWMHSMTCESRGPGGS